MKALKDPGALLKRAVNSSVAWAWIFNGLRLASGLILLPLVLNKLPTADLGMYYVLLNLTSLVPLVDFGFGPTIGRFVSYAMAGAEEIQAQGVAKPGAAAAPNYRLLWDLLFTTRRLYRYLTVALFVLLGAWGTYMVEVKIHETSSVLFSRIAWGITLVSALFDIYSSWWVNYLRNMNQVLLSGRILVVTIVVRLVVAAVLLLFGAGLISLPAGIFLSSLLLRQWSRAHCRRLLGAHPEPRHVDTGRYLRILWPNSWRLGMQFLSGCLVVQGNTFICLNVLHGLTDNARYGLSYQLFNIISGMSAAWMFVKWPMVGQYLARNDLEQLRKLFWPRFWLQTLSFLAAVGMLFLVGPFLLAHFGGGKSVLPAPWFALMAAGTFLEMQFSLWGTAISMSNRLPYLWPAVATNLLGLALAYGFARWTSLGLGALVLGPLLSGLLFNSWYWPIYAARMMGTSLLRFVFTGPR